MHLCLDILTFGSTIQPEMSKTQVPEHRDYGDVIRRTIEAAPSVSMAELLEATGLTRPGVLYHLKNLIAAGEVEYVDKTRGRSVRYRAAYDNRWVCDVSPEMSEHALWSELKDDVLDPHMTPEARTIHEYVFGEMVNNVIEHAQSATLTVTHRAHGGSTWVSVRDAGVGIFYHIAASENLPDEFSSIRKLQSGAFTTDPESHTGEGLFFASRAVDEFSVSSGGIAWITNNVVGDQTVKQIGSRGPGTSIVWRLQDETRRSLTGLFDFFSIVDDDDIPQFAVTSIAVAASEKGTQLLTRSQAQELLEGKDAFQVIILDFSNVSSIGQGFADEVFRVYPMKHEGVSIVDVNANPAVSWMVRRAKEGPRQSIS
ncbi:histidine kinase-, DNA gyrase B-, and HSP90-like ATPase [bacterium BMS3Bbin01]|nr:histidine kinase-, DNA gyrase B-, and HSP90-like ATPase [bacterium BMS3Bbin01]